MSNSQLNSFFIAVILLICPLAGFADNSGTARDCRPIRLDDPGKSMEKIPVMDQDSKWICYAYTASQMADAWRFSHGDHNTTHLTSPVATAVFYASQRTDFPTKDIDNGWQAGALASIAKNGSCDYKAIYTKFGTTGLKEYFGELNKYFQKFKLLAIQESNSSKISQDYAKAVQCAMKSANTQLIPEIPEIINALSQPNYLEYLSKLFQNVCASNSIDVHLPDANTLWTKNFFDDDRVSQIQKTMNKELNGSNPQPIGINYCENILWDKSVQGINSSGEFDWSVCKHHHISVVIGQQPTTDGRCEFLVRNSFGQSCNAYPKLVYRTDEELEESQSKKDDDSAESA